MNQNPAKKALADAKRLLKSHKNVLGGAGSSELLRAYRAGPVAYKEYIKKHLIDNPFAGKPLKKITQSVRPINPPVSRQPVSQKNTVKPDKFSFSFFAEKRKKSRASRTY